MWFILEDQFVTGSLSKREPRKQRAPNHGSLYYNFATNSTYLCVMFLIVLF